MTRGTHAWLRKPPVSARPAVSFFWARESPSVEVLTQTSRAIASGTFSQRVHLWSRTEIGELTETSTPCPRNSSASSRDLKKAAEKIVCLFMGSIQM